ncbi:family 16 glycoside hydrolase [Runella sp.]|uniref:family 16 glycoside hydrolase n=1 Tax=Runella sp. TaxID=1960881 RepID=UPI003D13E5F9
MTSRFSLATIFLCACMLSAFAQQKSVAYDLYDLNAKGKLQVFNRTLTPGTDPQHKGISFSEKEGEGIAWLEGIAFQNGVIELDIKGKDVLQRSFVGVAFHGEDDKTFDAVYFRPFNFQATDSVRRIHAVQYVSHPDFPWEKLRATQNGKYEKSVSPAPNPNEWFHAKIAVDYPHVLVYINNSSVPSLSIDKLNQRQNGKIGLWVGNTSGGDFANLSITNK